MAHEMKLMKVKGNGCHLQWPVPPFPEQYRSRGGQGYVVDLGHPLECGYDEQVTTKDGQPRFDEHGMPLMRHVTGWCEGQLQKLEDAPDAKEPSKIELPAARLAMAEFNAARAPKAEAPAAPAAPAPEPAPKAEAPAAGRKKREPVQVIEGG